MLYKQGRYQRAYDLLHDVAIADSRLLLKEIELKLVQSSPTSQSLEK